MNGQQVHDRNTNFIEQFLVINPAPLVNKRTKFIKEIHQFLSCQATDLHDLKLKNNEKH